MDAVRYIEENLNPRTILEHYGFEQISETDDSFRACCRIHGGNNPTGFVWKKENNLWFCYTGDCHGGDVFNLVQKMEQVDFVTSVSITAGILGLSIAGMDINIQEERIRKEQMRWLQKQRKKEVVNEIYQLPNIKYYDTHDTFSRFDKEILEHFNAKFCNLYPTDTTMLRNKLVIPIYHKGEIIAVALRDTTGTFFPKWFYQPKGVKLNCILYNLDEALEQQTDEIILVEGIFDVWAYHRIGIKNVVAIFGSTISKDQYKLILKSGKCVTLSFDNDDAGNKCLAHALEQFKNKTEVKVITLPVNKDPADCTKEELLNAYLNRTKPCRSENN